MTVFVFSASLFFVSLFSTVISMDLNKLSFFENLKNDNLIKFKIQYLNNYYSDNKELETYILEILDSKSNIMSSFEFYDAEDNYFLVGLGKFDEYYNIPISEKIVATTLNKDNTYGNNVEVNIIDNPLNIIGSNSISINTVDFDILTGTYNKFTNLGIHFQAIDELVSQIILINPTTEEVSLLENEINKRANNFIVKDFNLTDQLTESLTNDINSNKFLYTYLTIVIIIFVLFFWVMVKNTTDKKIRELSINLMCGAPIKFILIREVLFYTNVGLISFIISLCFALYTKVPILNFLTLYSILLIIFNLVYPILNLLKLNLNENMRGDF